MNCKGIKKLTIENMVTQDEAFSNIRNRHNGLKLSEKDWFKAVFKYNLSKEVPIDIQELFYVAQGAMLYGYYFYPLFTLATEQLFRVVEAAVTKKCKLINGLTEKAKFEKKINFLIRIGIIKKEDKNTWLNLKKLRNRTSHPVNQNIFPPSISIRMLETTSKLINALFS